MIARSFSRIELKRDDGFCHHHQTVDAFTHLMHNNPARATCVERTIEVAQTRPPNNKQSKLQISTVLTNRNLDLGSRGGSNLIQVQDT
jgi:hypothetical protein